ncbi:MAG: RloB domain-containing protein [Bacteroidales bacterium]|nr:RloB domain-containing protein [Bacteroidales bacterium]
MARVAKIDNVIKKRFEREEKKRSVEIRTKLVYFLIVCEGEKTEPNYFKALEDKLPRGTVELKVDGIGRNTIGLVDYAIRQRDISCRKYDRVWVVFDKDDFPDDNFNGAIIKAHANSVNCAWTNEAFELWFLLHFQFVNTGLKRADYKAYLEREIRKKSGFVKYKYLKNDFCTFSFLENYGNQEQAIEWAKQLKQKYTDQRYSTHNPCTRVHELIEELLNPQDVLNGLESEK